MWLPGVLRIYLGESLRHLWEDREIGNLKLSNALLFYYMLIFLLRVGVRLARR